jgi:cytochrome c-type biogenesis protein CcmF
VTLRVLIHPLALWLWVGGGVMAFGTILAAWPGRRRRPTDPTSAPLEEPEPEPEPEAEREPAVVS